MCLWEGRAAYQLIELWMLCACVGSSRILWLFSCYLFLLSLWGFGGFDECLFCLKIVWGLGWVRESPLSYLGPQLGGGFVESDPMAGWKTSRGESFCKFDPKLSIFSFGVYVDAPLFPYSSLFPQDIIQGVFGVHPVTTYIAWVSTKEFWIFMGIKETYSSILGINFSNLNIPMCVK